MVIITVIGAWIKSTSAISLWQIMTRRTVRKQKAILNYLSGQSVNQVCRPAASTCWIWSTDPDWNRNRRNIYRPRGKDLCMINMGFLLDSGLLSIPGILFCIVRRQSPGSSGRKMRCRRSTSASC